MESSELTESDGTSAAAEAAVGEESKQTEVQPDGGMASGVEESAISCRNRSPSPPQVSFIGPLPNPAASVDCHFGKDIPDPFAVHGSCGLYNLGNTCFMNAGIQALASCTPLLKFFFEEFHFEEGMRGTLTGAFYILLCKMWSGRFSVVHPRQFKELLGLYHPQFQDYRQHDCQEFLALLLDTFHEQLNQQPGMCTASVVKDKAATLDETHPSDHLNNQEQAMDSSTATDLPGEVVNSTDNSAATEEVEAESLPEKEVDLCGASPDSELLAERGGQGGSTQARSSLKRTSSSPADATVAVLISEDSNHSSVSVQSTDSEQTNAFKKLKIEAENAAGPSSMAAHTVEETSPKSDVDTEVTLTMPHLDALNSDISEHSDILSAGVASESIAEPMEIAQDCECCAAGIAQGGVEDESAPSSSGLKNVSTEQTHTNTSSENENSSVFNVLAGSPSRVFNKVDNRPDQAPTLLSSSSPLQTSHAGNVQASSSSSQEQNQSLPCLEDYYCKETKTLNTNVLVSCYNHGDVIAVDSEKFAKIDNRSQVPVAKEVNLLQEALQDIDSDKVDKALIGKTLGSKSSNIHSVPAAEKNADTSSNLRMVKTHNTTVLRKPSFDSSLLNNSYEFEDDVLGFEGLVPSPLKGERGAMLGMDCSKSEEDDVGVAAKMMGMAEELNPLEVEKNVQMQALSKFKTAMAKSNIREDISDKASTSESTETEDADMDAESSEEEEDEEEETPSRDIVGEDNPGLLNPARCYTAADVAAANASWESYKARNNSVVVNTFQGQFKSTVVCSECDHVSVTYEPFMYLSLPIPHAMERQMCVVFIRPREPATRYMVTLHKNDKVQRLRQELQALTDTSTCDVILAEVLDRHISRLLDDNIMLRYVNDSSRTIFAFEMLPPPEVAKDGASASTVESLSPLHHISSSSTPNIPPKRPAETCTSSTQDQGDLSVPLKIDTTVGGAEDVFPEGRRDAQPDSPLLSEQELDFMLSGPSASQTGAAAAASSLTRKSFYTSSSNHPEVADPMLAGIGLPEWSQDRHYSSSSSLVPEVSPPPCSPLSDPSPVVSPDYASLDPESAGCFGEDFNPDFNPLASVSASCHQTRSTFEDQGVTVDVDAHCQGDDSLQSPTVDQHPSGSNPMWPGDVGEGTGDVGAGSSPRGAGLMDQWQICAICLEEMMDSELLTHVSCSGVFCHTCLEMSAKHSGDLAHCCPICLSPVDVTQDFVPLASTSPVQCKVRILAVPVTFRSELQTFMEDDEGSGLHLICSPQLLYVASQQDASTLYALTDKISPFRAAYSLYFTDGQGLRCSRCEYTAHCTGCEIPRKGEVMLQPGDNLSVQFSEPVPAEKVERANQVFEDKSLKHLRSRDPISIFDCFDAFTQSEVLDEHNPWYCPCCRRNQCAKKTMTVWRYPDSLIIHLKRFVYEDLASMKIDNRVVFPHTDLDVTRFLAGPPMSFNVYDLHSIVCHYGGANSGHYTSFTYHPLTQEWYNYNDETVAQQKPGDSEYDSGYVLFYRRQGTQVEFNLIKDLPFSEEEEEVGLSSVAAATSTTLYNHQPPPSCLPVPVASTTITLDMDSLPLGESEMGQATEADTCDNNSYNYDFYN